MKHLPKISIVTPTFNQGQFIEQTIQSVLDQGYPNLEYLIIDGGSTDNTQSIIRKYEKYLAYWVSESDRGQSHAINKGLERCTGDIFNWINSDDYYNENVFAKVAAGFESDETKMFCGRSFIFGGEKEWTSDGTKLPDPDRGQWVHPSIDQPATFFRMETVRKFGNLTEKLHYTMDLEWLMKYWLEYGVSGMKRSEDVFINFREHPGSKTVQFQKKFTQERILLYRSLIRKLKNKDYSDTLYNFNAPAINIPEEWIYKTTNKLIYMELQVHYGKRKFKDFFNILDVLVPEALSGEERAIIKRQKRRAGILRLIGR